MIYFNAVACKLGFRGPNCQYKCKYPAYGEDCQMTCERNCNESSCNYAYGCDKTQPKGIRICLICMLII